MDVLCDLVKTRFANRPEYLATYDVLQSPALKPGLLRYLVLAAAGGVYSDLDTKALKPVDQWIPYQCRPHARLLVRFKWNQRGAPKAPDYFVYPIQFQQWAIAAAPGHPPLQDMLGYAQEQLQGLAVYHNTTLSSLQFTDEESWTATGSRAWTATIWQYLYKNEGLANLTDLSCLQELKLFEI